MQLTDSLSVSNSPCPCGSGRVYAACCGPLHDGSVSASTAQQLMRSRYSAYVLRNEAYLLQTWDPSTRPTAIDFPDDLTWIRLEIRKTKKGGVGDKKGIVEFRALYRCQGQNRIFEETSRFQREGQTWFYLSGIVKPSRPEINSKY